MARLSRYLLRLFWSDAMALFAVAVFLLFLIQCLRLFDLVSSKGQGLLTLIGQVLLGMPGLGVVFLYVCLAIGLGRTLRNLQSTTELQIIHANSLVPTLLRAIGLYVLGGVAIVLLLSHLAEPLGIRASNDWSSSIAADLVSRSMIPHRFTGLGGGVSMVIGARDADGNITDFFADDPRDTASHRTYFAHSAIITHDEEGYVLRMRDGAVQYLTEDNTFSQVSFDKYDLPLDRLTGATDSTDPIAQTSSIDLVGAALSSGVWDPQIIKALLKRTGEGLRVIAMSMFVAAVALFPNGQRRRTQIPIELVVLAAAFIERAFTSYVGGPGLLGVASGSVLLIAASTLILLVRLRVFQPAGIRRLSA